LPDGNVYAIYLADENENFLPVKINFDKFPIENYLKVELLGSSAEVKINKNKNEIEIPEAVRNNPPCKYAWVFKLLKTK